jgi:hypothetical protein
LKSVSLSSEKIPVDLLAPYSSAEGKPEHSSHGHDNDADHDSGHDAAHDHEADHDADNDHEATHDHDADHAHDGDHDAEHAEEHGDIEAIYEFTCSDVSKLNSLGVNLFAQFPSLEEIEVQLVSDKGQRSFELTKSGNTIEW